MQDGDCRTRRRQSPEPRARKEDDEPRKFLKTQKNNLTKTRTPKVEGLHRRVGHPSWSLTFSL